MRRPCLQPACRHCFIPPYMAEHLAGAEDPDLRSRALAELAVATELRTERRLRAQMPALMARPAPSGGRHRQIYNAAEAPRLPGRLVRSEGHPPSGDAAVDEAYDHSGVVWDFYDQVFDRQSLDDRGMTLVSSVHMAAPDGGPLDNAFWNGEQMAYGDGDGVLFGRFTASLEVVGHELTHGVQAFTSRLAYMGEAGALNEHFADVFGILVKQWKLGIPARESDWLVGADVLRPLPGRRTPGAARINGTALQHASHQPIRRAIRDMLNPGEAFRNDPLLGDDPQPAHASQMYRGPADHGGVHLNSGIPNRAFALAALELGGPAWEVAGRIWYEAMTRLKSTGGFADCARQTLTAAQAHGPAAVQAVDKAWRAVGVTAHAPLTRSARPARAQTPSA